MYWPAAALRGQYVWDDDNYVTENSCLRDGRGLLRIWTDPTATPQYYPLVHTTFWVEYQLWNLRPVGYHFDNVVLHAINAVLLIRLLRQLRIAGAVLAGLLFAFHPVHVESVAWITERKNVLSAFFYLLAAGDFFRYDSAPDRRMYWYRSLLFYFAALLSKTVTVTLPPVLLLVVWWRDGRVRKRQLQALIPFLVIGIPMGLLTVWLERHHVGASGTAWSLTFFERLLIAGRSIWFHLGKLLCPYPLNFVYPRFGTDATDPTGWIAVGLVLTFIVYGLVVSRKNSAVRATVTGFLLFCGTLFPALGFFDIFPMQYTFVADHYQYLASIGPLVVLAAVTQHLIRSARVPAIIGFLLAIGILATRTNVEARRFLNAESLWRATLAGNPDCSMAHTNLGDVLRSQGRIQAAAAQYMEAVRLDPDDPVPAVNLAAVALVSGDLIQAEQRLRRVLQKFPEQDLALYNLGVICSERGQHEEAVSLLQRAVAANPSHAPAVNALGLEHAQAGQYSQALRCFQKAHQLAPLMPDFLVNLGAVQQHEGEYEQSLLSLKRALELSPDHRLAMIHLAEVCRKMNRRSEAAAIVRRLLELHPEDPECERLLEMISLP
ncbi:MAG: tetratricopeptide repeat protein [Planctomycetaceae bacterium]